MVYYYLTTAKFDPIMINLTWQWSARIMTVIAFDTLKYSKHLIEAGVPQRQAEGQAEALAQVVDEQLATKQDLKELEHKILMRLGSLIIIAVSLSTAILGILISVHH
jgi:hypothetical protein